MAANIDTMMYVKEVPWHGLGHRYDTPPATSEEIVKAAQLDWRVNTARMSTDLHGEVLGYHAVYREDNNEILGVVNKYYPSIVQNTETFQAFENILGKEVTIDTAASLGRGEVIFGCFKINEGYKLVDDDVDHYLVVMNEHLKPDGKITLLNTPVRVVCQNTLSAALNNNSYKVRIPVYGDKGANAEIARKVITGAANCIRELDTKAQRMLKQKVDRDYVDKLLDELFPFIKVDGETTHSKANEATEIIRDTFITECMGAPDLANYRGTQYQIFNALTDFSTHYFKNVDKAYDLNYRMSLLPGMGTDNPGTLVSKYLKIKDKLIA